MQRGSRLSHEIWAVVVFSFAVLLILSLVSYHPADRPPYSAAGSIRELYGFVGYHLANFLRQGVGLSAYLMPIFLLLAAYQLFHEAPRVTPARLAGYAFFLLLSVPVFLSVFIEADEVWDAGGVVGGFSKRAVLTPLFGRVGTYVVSLSLFLLGLMLATPISLAASLQATHKAAKQTKKLFWACANQLEMRLKEKRRKKENTKKEQKEHSSPPPVILKEETKDELAKRARKKPQPVQEEFKFPVDGKSFILPSISLLDSTDGEEIKIDKDTLEANARVLQKKLADFGVEGEVVAVRPGPVITMYEFNPAPGVKVRRIVTLADDLSMALRAVSVRILAPIPGESVVGIEIPNPKRAKVFLRQIIESDSFQNADSSLTLALGKQISGVPFVTDLARMPHLLVAGATGTGKSISINVMILSILFKSTPHDVQFIMIDPKMLELTVYEDLPNLLVPVVTDPKKAAAALFWAMDEMDRRYRMMREKGARNIDHYNRILEKDKELPPKKPIDLEETTEAHEGKEANNGNRGADQNLVHERLPRIVIVVDELADLMMSVGRDIEEYITRLAQKARAAGIHLILATQRPSVDVITGLIKANFPARISFQVTSRVDSRTILDSIGAERLLGDGDLLFLPPASARLTRVHGAYVSDQEIRRVVDFIKQQARPQYREEVFEARKEVEKGQEDDDYDEMYDRAVEVVTESQQASISMVQRRLRVGYNRAARMIEQMERDGIVGPAEAGRPREVYGRKIDE
jgi:S-DNA-T family DNA segregation ATPase FtsK/SpoIIIE